ncbi:MAG: phage tail protein [Chloroflexi bacterium]|nr:phage tail protein [Chloroflexota bacterium]
MSEPFLAEIKLVSFGYAPRGYAFCNGQLLSIAQNSALFSLLGTSYGGNGQTTFGLPDMRGRVPVHWGGGFVLGQQAGQENHTLINSEMPAHNHLLVSSNSPASTPDPNNNLLAVATVPYTTSASPTAPMNPTAVSIRGGNQPHDNMQPYLVMNFIIAIVGIFPSRS